MEAFVYLRVRPGSIGPVRDRLTSTAAARRSVVVIGEWDILCLIDGPDLATVATGVLSELQTIEGVERTFTAPVVPPDRLGVVGFGGPSDPADHPGRVLRPHRSRRRSGGRPLRAALRDRRGSGAAVLGGRWDLMACIPEPWEVASAIVLDKIHALPGVRSTSTLVSVDYEEPEEDRDQFSSWS